MEPPLETHEPAPRSNRLLIVGAAVALIAGLAIAWALIASGRGDKVPPPPASEGGLVIEAGEDGGKIDPAKPLRCFVQGQFVGDLTLSDCARRNGVATDALDVGLDASGALAATPDAAMPLTPLPPDDTSPEAEEGAPAPDALPEVVGAPPPGRPPAPDTRPAAPRSTQPPAKVSP